MKKLLLVILFWLFWPFLFSGVAEAGSLTDQLVLIRDQVSNLEQDLLANELSSEGAKVQIRKIQKLLKFQQEESKIGQKRIEELERTVVALESRQTALRDKIDTQRKAIRKYLVAIEASSRKGFAERSFHLPEHEKLEAPRRRVLANSVDRGLKEIEALKVDLLDAEALENRIQEEKQQLAYLFQDLQEQESVLELNRQLQIDFLKKKQKEKLMRLGSYRKLKSAEAQVETLIGSFNARMELEKSEENEKIVSKAMKQGIFSELKGKLQLPVIGAKISSSFGRSFDRQSGLYVFKKGVDLSVEKDQAVQAIAMGRIAFSGKMPQYGEIVIIDHGDHFYSLYAHLGKVLKKTNESVREGDMIALTGDSVTPLYFEIRARNVAVNPLQWVAN